MQVCCCLVLHWIFLLEVKINGPLRKKQSVRKNTSQSSTSGWCPHVVTCTGQAKGDGKISSSADFLHLEGSLPFACPVELSPFLSYHSDQGCPLFILLRFLNIRLVVWLTIDSALWHHKFYFLLISTVLHCHPFVAHTSHHSCGCVSVQFQKSSIKMLC